MYYLVKKVDKSFNFIADITCFVLYVGGIIKFNENFGCTWKNLL